MEPWDDRGQSIQIGAVLIFAALILLLSLYQATIVPQQNEQVEFDHNQQVRGDLLDLRNAVTSMFGESASRSVSIQLGTTYPSRVLAVNPPPVSGLLRTVGTADGSVYFGLANAVALDSETDDFWNGTGPIREYSTGAVVYRPSYNEYGQPPRTVYDSTVLYDDFTFEEATITRSEQALVSGSTISLVALNGSLQRSASGATAVDVRSVNASSTTVSVKNKTNGPLTIQFSTRLSRSTWEGLLEDESNFIRVRSVGTGPGEFETLAIDLKPGTYDLRMAKVGVGTRVTGTDPAYMTDVAADGSTVPEDGSVRLTVEVRDEYNNPVAGVDVTGSPSDGTLAETELTTGGDGRVSFVYEAPGNVGSTMDVPVEFSFRAGPTTPFDPDDPEDIEAVVSVQNTQGSGPSGGGSAPYSVTWDSPTASEGGTYLSSCDDADCTWDVGSDGDDTLDLSAVVADAIDGTAVEGADVDFAVNDSSVATLTSAATESDTSDGSGSVETTLTAGDSGTVRVYAVSGGASDTLNVTIPNRPPSAAFTVSPTSPADGEQVTFDASGSSDPDGSIASYEWDFGDGSTASGESVTHSYGSTGTYTATLTLTDDSGATSVLERDITVGPGDTTAPSIASATLPGTPIDDTEANNNVQRTLTLTFDEAMDQSVAPAVSFTNVGASSVTAGSGTWVDSTTYEVPLTFSDNDVDETVDVGVSNARDTAGNEMAAETALSFVIDTQAPGDPNGVRIEPDTINTGNDGSVDVVVVNPDTVRGDETAVVTLEDEDGATVTASAPITTGAGAETTVTVDASSLADGTVTPTAYVRDDVGNTGGSVSNDATEKETTVPSITGFDAANTGGNVIDVSFDSDEDLDTIAVEITDSDGTVVATLTESDFAGSGAGTYSASYTASDGGSYTATLTTAEDAAGNDGATGQSDSVTISAFQGIVDDFEDSADLSGTANWSRVNADASTVFVDDDAGTANSGTRAVHIADIVSNGGIVSKTLDTTALSDVTVSAAVRQGDPDGDTPNAGEDLLFQYRDANGNWVTSETVTATNSLEDYQRYAFTIDDAGALHSNFAVRVVQESTNGFEDSWFVDDVCVVAASGDCPFGGSASGSLAYNDDAEAVDGPDGDATAGGVEFSLANQYGDDVEVQSVTVDYPGANARLNDDVTPNDEPQRTEVYVAGATSDGWVDVDGGVDLPAAFDMDADGFSNNGNPVTSGGSSFSVYLYEFVDGGGNRLDMDGETITVEVTYSVGGGASQTESYTITVGGGGGNSPPLVQSGIRYDGGLTTTTSDSAVQFDVTNVDSSDARVLAVSVTAGNGVGQRVYNDEPDEINIPGSPDGYEDVDGNPTANSLTADGSRIALDQTAVIGPSTGSSVFIGQFGTTSGNSHTQYDFTGLTRVTSSDSWDVRVVLELQGRQDVTFYFRES
ncbi:hypothetical protein C475_08321 [Halosimplex carlsbadense 2-9-1]|uniref:PKD domain-containing protein n=1 Tax=Halosimplex carlsbadense 2-9-1 TaxID=797114 RepID=M0CUK7_9EURY|nr:PKD domain-containing protein [Halosimplex carlsbadense]ELZ26925.1 hypothetical protein C475_08321 [Halosimplex carlsbadense 2-9-1]